LIDLVGERTLADPVAVVCRLDRIIADFDLPAGMGIDAVTEMAGEHLRAKADSEKRLVLVEWHLDPLDFAAQPVFFVVGAHRAAEDDGSGIVSESFRQRIAESRPADVEFEAAGA
jgi:hypothetical protein